MGQIASRSSIHCLEHIFNNNEYKIVRFLFALAFCASIFGFVHYFQKSYFQWKVVQLASTKNSEIDSDEIPLPAMTICPNLVGKHEIFRHEKDFDHLSENSCKYLTVNSLWCKTDETCSYKLEDKNVIQLMNESALEINEFFHSCKFSETEIDCEKMFNRIFTNYGICYSFNLQGFQTIFNKNEIHEDFNHFRRTKIAKSLNVKNPLHNQTFNDFQEDDETVEWTLQDGYLKSSRNFPISASKLNVLDIVLKINKTDAEFICYKDTFTVIFNLPIEIPSYHKEFPLQLGEQKSFYITASVETSYPELASTPIDSSDDDRNCYFENERNLQFFKTYTEKNCEVECRTNSTFNKCGCVQFSMVRNNSMKLCGLKDQKCVEKYSYSDCYCLYSCTHINYYLQSDVGTAYANEKLSDNVFASHLEVRFDFSSNVEVKKHFFTYRLQNFFSDSGGLLGLFLGSSLLSIIEIFYLVTCTILNVITRSRIKNKAKIKTEKLEFIRIATILKELKNQNQIIKILLLNSVKTQVLVENVDEEK